MDEELRRLRHEADGLLEALKTVTGQARKAEAEVAQLQKRLDNQAQASMDLVDAIARVRALCAAESDPHPWHDHICPKDVLDALDGA